ncbi:MAG: hypothetical protein K5662_04410 [Lachnospiraceae bacterium]|nr:hypothetical protein [Lachnospiraceae bacterium]
MKIDSYSVGMDSARTYSSFTTRKLTVGASMGLATDTSLTEGNTPFDFKDAMNQIGNRPVRDVNKAGVSRTLDDIRERFVLYLWHCLFGDRECDRLAKHYGITPAENATAGPTSGFSTITLQSVQEVTTSIYESTSFKASGNVATADGRTIDFELTLELTSSFESYYREEGMKIVDMIDPLVICYEGTPPTLTDVKFVFDLDADGTPDDISLPGTGSGLLSLDLNGDGIINDGSELFGTRSGNGFADLATYDEDMNGWIDEGDAFFNRLKILVSDEEGNLSTFSLKDKGVGAICLHSVANEHTFNSSDNSVINGVMRRTGFFLYEDGSGAGTVHHFDLAN